MKFGIYIHIPYCLQICPYCDFAKYEVGKIPDQNHYTQLLLREIRQKHHLIPKKPLTSIYFGGGTPSLLSEEQFAQIIGEIRKHFSPAAGLEITIEINPGNLSEKKLVKLLELGVNRFSVGSQTFDDKLLKDIGRKHSSKETADTLTLLNKYKVNFTMDLLFALPNQTLETLEKDLEESLKFSPRHVSTYYLNVPEKHSLSKNRPEDETQVKMFELIESTLADHSLHRYEISNYAQDGFESKHNLLYWTDQPYWGIGLSSHSFLEQDKTDWGMRFWNPKSYESYEKHVRDLESPSRIFDGLETSQVELLEKHQSMTEFCYTSLRKMTGLDLNEFEKKFSTIPKLLTHELSHLISKNLVQHVPTGSRNAYILTQEGKIISNLVFERLTFLKEDLY
jgi:oxygen-independent coproporphyrinogen-3 oxidase